MPRSPLLPLFVLLASHIFAAEPLHTRIDAIIAAAADGPVAPRSGDPEFVRRIYLDLAGRIPTAEETRSFLADSAAEKRAALIDKLLAGEDHRRRMETFLHVMLMERLGDHVEWRKFLRGSLAAEKPWTAMVKEMLNPNADDEANRGAAFFYTKRLENYGQNAIDTPGLVRDVGRLFLGIDVQCAQCHDHLFVDDYKQEFYHGLLAYVGQASIRSDAAFPAVFEKPLTTKLDFMSVFVKEPRQTGPLIPGRKELEIPMFAKGEEYEVKPDRAKKIPGTPKFSVLAALGTELPQADNELFRRNIANRLWWLLMGRGLVQPLDLQHAGNPASHPELLELLANEFAAGGFVWKPLLREICLSETYQRTSVAPDEAFLTAPPEKYRLALEKPLLPEQRLAAMLVATGEDQRVRAIDDAKNESHLDKLTERFAKALGQPPREAEIDHAPSVKGALFVMNDAVVLSWLEPRDGNLLDRVKKLDNPQAVADEIFLSVLSRPPSEEEVALVTGNWELAKESRAKLLSRLVWSLLASNEFAVNH